MNLRRVAERNSRGYGVAGGAGGRVLQGPPATGGVAPRAEAARKDLASAECMLYTISCPSYHGGVCPCDARLRVCFTQSFWSSLRAWVSPSSPPQASTAWSAIPRAR